jgi:1,4-alpha-glucan branching enzyme
MVMAVALDIHPFDGWRWEPPLIHDWKDLPASHHSVSPELGPQRAHVPDRSHDIAGDRRRSANGARGPGSTGTTSGGKPATSALGSDPLWYKDAVIYEVHVRSFADSNGDGVGDFTGLIRRLDYIQSLGVTALWLLPFYPSPLRDGGYDIADYLAVHPAYGRVGDVRRLVREAHRRGLSVITELVCNHTSSLHPWFQRARRAPRGSAWRDFYVWSDTDQRYREARVIFKDFETSNWTWDAVAQAYYWHRFYSHQPDLNFDSPRVKDAILWEDIYLFNEGSHFRIWDKLGAHPIGAGTQFAVWAPNAESVSVVGDHNGWDAGTDTLRQRGSSGIWEGFVLPLGRGAVYKYHIATRGHDRRMEKADPIAFTAEVAPKTGSVVWDLDYEWSDAEWMRTRHRRNAARSPWSIYEVHVGSWMRAPEEDNRSLHYWELSGRLADYCTGMGFTHVQLMPVMEHPFFGSWGYQTTGYFAPTSRFGTPQDLMKLIDQLHERGIGVILDWVPSHFPTDEHGLAYFDGTHLYEHADPRRGFHPEWTSYIFNLGRHEVRSFLISSALFWLDRYHADGLRVDGVASILYLDYARKTGEWIPNEFGGHEDIEAIEFLRRLNTEIYAAHPDVQTVAEESTDWPMVSRPAHVGGLGFGMKWDMGWMHDTLQYMRHSPVHRRHHHGELTFRAEYAFTENFVLPLSHDEVVHGKGSLLGKMPGDEWQKRANLRLLFGWQWTTPGKKLLFMGGEIGQASEWAHDGSIEWQLVDDPAHKGIQRWVADLNRLYASEPALHELDFDPAGFSWVDASDGERSVVSVIRSSSDGRHVLGVFNFTPVPRPAHRLGVPQGGYWHELLNSDSEVYGGSGWGNRGGVQAEEVPWRGSPFFVAVTVPPLGAVLLAPSRSSGPAE